MVGEARAQQVVRWVVDGGRKQGKLAHALLLSPPEPGERRSRIDELEETAFVCSGPEERSQQDRQCRRGYASREKAETHLCCVLLVDPSGSTLEEQVGCMQEEKKEMARRV